MPGFHPVEFLILSFFLIWLISMAHTVLNRRLPGIEKIAWILFIFFTNWIGALVYLVYWYAFAKKRRSQIEPAAQPVYYVPSQLNDARSEQPPLTYEQPQAIYPDSQKWKSQ